MNFYEHGYSKPYKQVTSSKNSYSNNSKYQYLSPQKSSQQASPSRYLNYYDQSPIFNQKNLSNTDNHLNSTQNIWQHLYYDGLKTQREIQALHLKSKNKEDKQCTFRPKINQQSKYIFNSSSNFLQRNHAWQENRIEKIIKQKEDSVNHRLKQCTFTPKINKYPGKEAAPTGQRQLQRMKQFKKYQLSHSQHINPTKVPKKQSKYNPYRYEPDTTPKRQRIKTEYQTKDIKKIIRKHIDDFDYE